jgi:hypothetical protein
MKEKQTEGVASLCFSLRKLIRVDFEHLQHISDYCYSFELIY